MTDKDVAEKLRVAERAKGIDWGTIVIDPLQDEWTARTDHEAALERVEELLGEVIDGTESWEEIKTELEKDRTSYRKLFKDAEEL